MSNSSSSNSLNLVAQSGQTLGRASARCCRNSFFCRLSLTLPVKMKNESFWNSGHLCQINIVYGSYCRTSRSRQSSVNGSQEDLIDRPTGGYRSATLGRKASGRWTQIRFLCHLSHNNCFIMLSISAVFPNGALHLPEDLLCLGCLPRTLVTKSPILPPTKSMFCFCCLILFVLTRSSRFCHDTVHPVSATCVCPLYGGFFNIAFPWWHPF